MSENPRPRACPGCASQVLTLTTTRGERVVVDAVPMPVLKIPRGRGFLLRDGDGAAAPIGDLHLRVLGRSSLGLRLHECEQLFPSDPGFWTGTRVVEFCADCYSGDSVSATDLTDRQVHECAGGRA